MKEKIKKGYGLRSPDKVVEDRINEVILLLSSRPNMRRGQMHTFFRERWKDKNGQAADWRTIDRIVSRAREELIERLNRSKQDFRCEVLAGYEKELADPDANVRNAARRGIREMLGLDAPKKVAIGGDEISSKDNPLQPITVKIVGGVTPQGKESDGD